MEQMRQVQDEYYKGRITGIGAGRNNSNVRVIVVWCVIYPQASAKKNDHDQAPMYLIAYTVSIPCQSQDGRLETV